MPKQLVSVGGERVLDRTVRQCLERGARVSVSGPQGKRGEKFFRVPGAELLQVEQNPEWYGTGRYYATRDHWGDQRCIILHGDVRFTDEAMDRIFEYDGDWNAFVRCQPSSTCDHSELFGVSFLPAAQPEFLLALETVANYRHRSVIRRAIGFEVWRYMAGVRGEEVECRKQFMPNVGRCTLIEDLTDDLDQQADLPRMIYQVALHAPTKPGVTSVIIPWSPTSDERRTQNLHWLLRQLEQRHPNWPVTLASDDRPGWKWNKPAAWLNGVAQAPGDVLVLLDADVWSDQLGEAVAQVRQGETEWIAPHTQVHRLDADATDKLLSGRFQPWDLNSLERPRYRQQPGAVPMVISRRLFLQVPPDQRFEGWGYEDTAWGIALTQTHGEMSRLEGPALHLFHTPDAQRAARQEGSEVPVNFESQGLYMAYKRALGDPKRMGEIVAEARCELSE